MHRRILAFTKRVCPVGISHHELNRFAVWCVFRGVRIKFWVAGSCVVFIAFDGVDTVSEVLGRFFLFFLVGPGHGSRVSNRGMMTPLRQRMIEDMDVHHVGAGLKLIIPGPLAFIVGVNFRRDAPAAN